MTGSLIALSISRRAKKEFSKLLKLRPKIAAVAWSDSGLALVAALTFLYALSLGPASLVSSINAIQPFYVLIIALLFSVFWPHILKETLEKKTLFLKALAIVFVLFGTFLIAA